MITIEDLFAGTGTEFGTSYYSTIAQCEAKAAYGKQVKAERAELDDDEDLGLSTGTAFHALKAIWARGQYDQLVLPMAGGEDPRDNIVKEAVRLAEAHNVRFPIETYGRIVAIEEHFEGPNFGVPFTGQADLIVYLTDADCDNLLKLRPGLLLPGEGYYNWDYKTSKARKDSASFFYRWSPQFMLYALAIQDKHPEWNVRGSIGDIIIKHKTLVDNSFQSVFCPIPNKETAAHLFAWLQRLNFATQNTEKLNHNPAACVDYMTHRPCPHLASGRCAYALARGVAP